MTEFLLIRHATPDYSEIDKRHYKGFGNDLAPLTIEGEKEALDVSKSNLLSSAEIIISSPYTRTLQTASIIAKELNLNLKVELDLMEWIPDKSYMYDDYSKVINWRKHYDENNGKCFYKDDNFEEKDEIITRVINVLKKYSSYSKVIVVTHGMVLNALTGITKPSCTQIVKYTLK